MWTSLKIVAPLVALTLAGRADAAAPAPLAKQIARYQRFFTGSERAILGGGVTPYARVKTQGIGVYAGLLGGRASVGKATVFHNGMAYPSAVADLSGLAGLMVGGGHERTETYILGKRGMRPNEVLPKSYRDRRVNLFFAGEGLARGEQKTWSANIGFGAAAGLAWERHALVTLWKGAPKKMSILVNVEEGKVLAAQASGALAQGDHASAERIVAKMEAVHQLVSDERIGRKMDRRAVGGRKTP